LVSASSLGRMEAVGAEEAEVEGTEQVVTLIDFWVGDERAEGAGEL